MTSGAFRLRVSNAGIFGLTDNERRQVRPTPVGRQIADPVQKAAARTEAFLRVPLYAPVYENYMRRFRRLTNVFSKKIENHACAVALHSMYYNFVRLHQTLRSQPGDGRWRD